MAKSDYLEAAVLNAALRAQAFPAVGPVFLSLYSTDPGDDDSGTELAGNGYARQAISFAAPVPGAGTIASSDSQTFTANGGDWVQATHFGIHDAVSGGNLLYHSPLDSPRQIDNGDSIVFNAGSVTGAEL